MFKLLLLFVLVINFAAVALAARSEAERLRIADLATDPSSFAGRNVQSVQWTLNEAK